MEVDRHGAVVEHRGGGDPRGKEREQESGPCVRHLVRQRIADRAEEARQPLAEEQLCDQPRLLAERLGLREEDDVGEPGLPLTGGSRDCKAAAGGCQAGM